MPVRITCRGTSLTDEQHAVVSEKVRNLKKYFVKTDRIEVIFTAEKFRRKCEINVHAGHDDHAAHCENGNEMAAFEKALKAMTRQIKESKNKMIERHHKANNAAKSSNRTGKVKHTPMTDSALF
ncbi:hypothetical protein BH09SUM1_BH09SUM1_30690 [soil metagenome]